MRTPRPSMDGELNLACMHALASENDIDAAIEIVVQYVKVGGQWLNVSNDGQHLRLVSPSASLSACMRCS